MIKAVIFDRDGVIIDSEYINVVSATKSFAELGINLSEEDHDVMIGRHPDVYHKDLLKKYDFKYSDFRPRQREIYYEIVEDVPVFDATVNLIKRLHKQKIPLAITTTGGIDSTKTILKRIGINDLFDVIVTKEDYREKKPSPEPYLVTAEKLGVSPEECVVIEDTEVGVESAKTAGMTCVALDNKYPKKQDFSRADLVVDSVDEITDEYLGK